MPSTLDLLVASLSVIRASRSLVLQKRSLALKSHSTEHSEQNTYGLPEGESIADRLRVWFEKQRRAVLASIPYDGSLPVSFPSLEGGEWTGMMIYEMVPLLRRLWGPVYQGSLDRLRRQRDYSDIATVLNPYLRTAIEKQSFDFCKSTNENTSRRLEDALSLLRSEFAEGLVERGETRRELTKRINLIFDGLTKRHATTIAATEASRAVHAAQMLAAQDSGVVAGKELLISADACNLCKMIATEAKRVRLDQPFAVVGDHPEYSIVKHPPLHPNCRCSMIDILLPEYGGPADVEWDLTLFHPEEEIKDGYEVPRGLRVPEPEPERIEKLNG